MDPLTHTLVGANLAATRLGSTTRYAAAALIAGANLPDIDAILYFTGHDDLALGFRRGWTHGVLAIAVLPVLLTGLLALLARMRRGEKPSSVRLLAISFLAVLTHPTLDWLNNYGMRWLMPFARSWSYGDSVYIMDPWLWIVLGFGFLAGQRPTPAMVTIFAAVVAALAWVVGRRSAAYLAIVGAVALLLFAVLLWKSKRSYAAPALAIASLYIVARLAIHHATVQEVRAHFGRVERIMVAPQPIDPTRWDFVAQTGDVYRFGRYTWRDRKLTVADDRLPVAKPSPEWEAARRHPSIRGFMTWVRFPWYEVEQGANGTRVLIHDARYAVRRRAGGWGGVEVVIDRRRD
jgi:inner membrane protein